MRIGVNALYLIPGGVGGTEIYLRELLAALARIDGQNEYFVFTNLETGADLVPRQANFQWKPQAVHARFRPARIFWEQTVLPLEASRYRLDVLFNPGFTAPVIAPCPCVTVFHDLQHKRHPEHFRWFDLPFWRLLLYASAHRSRRLIAVSESTKADLLRFYHLPAERIQVIPHGVEPAFFELDRTQTEPYLLCVSTLHPHKNIERLLRAYGREKREYRLILAGMRGFHTRPIEALIGTLNLGDSVQLTGWIPREELYRLYERARAFVYPSTFEGFGMPVLEAMAAGVPAACSDIPPLREIAGTGSDRALFFDPLDEDSIAEALDRIMTDEPLRRSLAAAGRERAREFTWERSAERTLAALRV
jgi:glycosyltransferase involved in cell wall biosynthesis